MLNTPQVRLTLLGLLALASGCSASPSEQLQGLVPALPEPWAEKLTLEDESEFRAYAVEQGADYLIAVDSRLRNSLRSNTLAEYHVAAAEILPALSRVREVLAEEYGFARRWERHQRYLELRPGEAFALRQLTWEAHDLTQVSEDAAGEADRDPLVLRRKYELLEEIVHELERRDAPIMYTFRYYQLQEYAAVLADEEMRRYWLNRVLSVEEEMGNHRITCQALGVLGSLEGEYGNHEENLIYWQRGIEIASKHRLADHYLRLHEFLANHYLVRGRLALAHESLVRGLDGWHAYGGSPNQLRPLLIWLGFNRSMACWELVERDLVGVDQALELTARWLGSKPLAGRRADILMIRGALAAHQGAIREAEIHFSAAEKEGVRHNLIDTTSSARVQRMDALLESRQFYRALEILPRALREAHTDGHRSQVLSVGAMAAVETQQWNTARTFLDSLAQLPSHRPWSLTVLVRYHTARIRMARLIDGAEAASREVEAACQAVENRLRESEARQEGYLLLHRLRLLREELHDIVAANPRLGYELEMQWRQIPGLMRDGEHQPAMLDAESPLLASASLVRRSLLGERSGLPPLPKLGDAQHLLYRVGVDSLHRFEVSGGSVDVHRIPITERELRTRIDDALRSVGEEAGRRNATVDRDLARRLHELAVWILPEELLQQADRKPPPQDPPTLWISADGPLQSLPFAILNLSPDEYRPLLEVADPVYRAASSTTTRTPGDPRSGLIVGPPNLRAGSPAWRADLPSLKGAVHEARALHERSPGTTLLEGDAATKAAILEQWEDASLLYFAGHVVKDREAPYISYIPLAPPSREREGAPEDEYLEPVEIRAATLRGRPLVVLSACSSGEPYLVPGAYAPGIGEAFLDAGATTVIQALWSVDDEAVEELMGNTMRAILERDASPTRALQGARRQMSREGAFTHPYYWGGMLISSTRTTD